MTNVVTKIILPCGVKHLSKPGLFVCKAPMYGHVLILLHCLCAGIASRRCLPSGVWDDVDTSDCTREDFAEVQDKVSPCILHLSFCSSDLS